MEKEVKIQIPEGYEIDREKSTFERIVFKKKGLTYKDVMEKLCPNENLFFIKDDGSIEYCAYCPDNRLADPNNAASREQLERILALNKLMNVAQYLNQMESTTSSRSGTQKFYLFYCKTRRELDTLHQTSLQWTGPTFNSEALARQAIEILGETEVKKAFGIFE